MSLLDIFHGVFLAFTTGYITSFPPSIHSAFVKAYDYPIARVGLFASVLATAFYAPVTAIIYGMGVAIISEDILKSSRNNTLGNTSESFQTEIESLRESLDIKVAQQMNPVEEALEKVKNVEQLLRKTISSSTKS